MATTSSGLVPQVTLGEMVAASIVTLLSKVAPSSLDRVRQRATARRLAAPCGAIGRPLR